MLKRLIFIVVTLAFAAGAGYMWWQFHEVKQPVSNAYHAIPPSAAIILEVRNAESAWAKLSEKSIIWEKLLGTETFLQLDRHLHWLDSVMATQPALAKDFSAETQFISAHMAGAKTYNFLFTIKMPKGVEEAALHTLIASATGKQSNTKTYDGAQINMLPGSGSEAGFSYTVFREVFYGSYSTLLVEDAVRHRNSGSSILDDGSFVKVTETAGTKTDANLYIRHKTLPPVVNTYLSDPCAAAFSGTSDYADWTELDINLKPDAVILNGFTVSPDSVNNFLGLFRDQKPQPRSMARVLPQNTATLLHFGYSDFGSYLLDYAIWLKKRNKLYEYQKRVEKINDGYDCNITKSMLGWVDEEVALLVTEPHTPDLSGHVFAVLKAHNIEKADQNLAELIGQVATTLETEPDTVKYRDFNIQHIDIPNLFPSLLGSVFKSLDDSWFVAIDEYYLFGNSPEALKTIINDHLAENTLAQDLHYQSYVENLSGKSNIFVYSSTGRSVYLYEQLVDGGYSKDIEAKAELFRQFEAVALEVSHDKDDLYYNNIYIKHNPVYKQATTTLWTVALDTSVSRQPQVVQNHLTKASEIFVQDDANRIYLISRSGKRQWDRKLTEPIISPVQQVDLYKNGKLQLLFNTRSKLWVLDRNGNDVPGFPIKLPAPASAPVAVMDYDNNRKYRILMPCANKEVYNYDNAGLLVKGWEFKPGDAPVGQPIQHFVADGKDYIVAIQTDGTVRVVDRTGEKRYKVTAKLPLSGHRVFLEPSKDVDRSLLITTDSVGNVLRLSFDGNLEIIETEEFTRKHWFEYADLNHDGSPDLIFVDGDRVVVYKQDAERLFEREFDQPITSRQSVFLLEPGIAAVGVVTAGSNQAFLYDELGKLRPGLPLFGSSAFIISDIDGDGSLNLVIGSSDKNLYTYTLE